MQYPPPLHELRQKQPQKTSYLVKFSQLKRNSGLKKTIAISKFVGIYI